MDDLKLLERISVNPKIFNGKPIIRGRRLAVEHILGMLAAGDAPETILEGYAWLEPEDIQACLVYAYKERQSRASGTITDSKQMSKLLLDTCVWGGVRAFANVW